MQNEAYVRLAIMQHLLIWLPIFFAVLVCVVACVVGGVKYILWRRAFRRAQKEAYEESHDEQGRRLPPSDRGICGACSRFSEQIFFLPDGSRLCKECFSRNSQQAETVK